MMPRPIHPRRVHCRFHGRAFKPVGVPMRDLPRVTLALDELEALRLSDLEGLYQEAAAERMGVSRATLGRILARAHSAVADALVNGKALVVAPGEVVEVPEEALACPVHWGGRRRGRGCRCGDGALGRINHVAPRESEGSDEPQGGHDAGR